MLREPQHNGRYVINMITTYWARRRARLKRARLAKDIEDSKARLIAVSIWVRYVGLVLVQGSSMLALLNMSMLSYWVALWMGLLIYQSTAIVFYIEDNRVYRMTKSKFDNRLGSTKATVKALAIKRNREVVYLIGNTCGLILIGLNILRALID